jgi:hypothetical protein
MGRIPSSSKAEVERQQTEWTGQWLCCCQQAAVSL